MLCSLITLLDLTWSIGADTAGLEVVDVADAQHHDVATAQHHVAVIARGKGGSRRKGGRLWAKAEEAELNKANERQAVPLMQLALCSWRREWMT